MKKNFDDFLKTLTPDKFNEMAATHNEANEDETVNLSNISNYIASTSIGLTIDLLNLYHEWLYSDEN